VLSIFRTLLGYLIRFSIPFVRPVFIGLMITLFLTITLSTVIRRDSFLLSYLRFWLIPGPFFHHQSIKEKTGVFLINYSNSTYLIRWTDPQNSLITKFYSQHDPRLVFKARLLNSAVRNYGSFPSGSCDSVDFSKKAFNSILKTLTNFDFCKPGDSIGIMFVEKDFSGFNSHVSDSCLIRLRVK
jgi:hypothetical protein